MPHRKAVDREYEIGGRGAGNAGDVHQAVEFAVDLLQCRVDAARVGKVHLDMAGHRGGRAVAVQSDHLGISGQQFLGGRMPDARRRARDNVALAPEFGYIFGHVFS